MTEDVRHHALTNIILFFEEILVVMKVVEALLPDHGGPRVEAIAANLTDLRMSLADVIAPRSQRITKFRVAVHSKGRCRPVQGSHLPERGQHGTVGTIAPRPPEATRAHQFESARSASSTGAKVRHLQPGAVGYTATRIAGGLALHGEELPRTGNTLQLVFATLIELDA